MWMQLILSISCLAFVSCAASLAESPPLFFFMCAMIQWTVAKVDDGYKELHNPDPPPSHPRRHHLSKCTLSEHAYLYPSDPALGCVCSKMNRYEGCTFTSKQGCDKTHTHTHTHTCSTWSTDLPHSPQSKNKMTSLFPSLTDFNFSFALPFPLFLTLLVFLQLTITSSSLFLLSSSSSSSSSHPHPHLILILISLSSPFISHPPPTPSLPPHSTFNSNPPPRLVCLPSISFRHSHFHFHCHCLSLCATDLSWVPQTPRASSSPPFPCTTTPSST
ncbi:MAG: hypothetical protein JOS17DRAFT_497820 [Linnemannia elongata]|nr:MAG: hypothetical protein JOS17DRAFT_497820 [Linnemannia elongata]